ncbi:hypothetical protein JHK87_012241 [Glycine soja]|nr:hypothetical protein JHK87_012241 [Glycine soja]
MFMDKDANSKIQLPPGFRFHPSDEELIVHYLRNKVTSSPFPTSFIAEIDLYNYNPWELPSLCKALFREDEWYFFTPRDRKYPNGVRPNRAAASGYWKAIGTDKPIFTSCGIKSIVVKKALVFYKGRPPKGSKTDWIMHEYRLHDSTISNSKQGGSMRSREAYLRWRKTKREQEPSMENNRVQRTTLDGEQQSSLGCRNKHFKIGKKRWSTTRAVAKKKKTTCDEEEEHLHRRRVVGKNS